MQKKIQKQINAWKKRSEILESQARDIEKSLIDETNEISETHVDLSKIAQAMILSARAIEIDICRMELDEILNPLKYSNE